MRSLKVPNQIPDYHLYGRTAEPLFHSFFHIRRLEVPVAGQTIIHQPHRHSNLYQLVWITHGDGTISVDTKRQELKAPAAFLLNPGCVHTCERGHLFQGFVVHFTPDYLDRTIASRASPTLANRILSEPTGEITRALHEMVLVIEREFQGQRLGRERLIYHHLNAVVAYLQRWHGADAVHHTTAAERLLVRFESLVEADYHSFRSVHRYADQLNVTPDHLSETVRTLTGRTAGEMIRARVVLEAQRLLAFTPMSVAEVAYQLNFADPAYFGRFFKQRTGLTPGAFRQQAG